MIPTEPIGSLPRSASLLATIAQYRAGQVSIEAVNQACDVAVRDTLAAFEATGSPVVTDGEQRKYSNFITYCVEDMPNLTPDGYELAFAAGKIRRLPRLAAGPFRYNDYADRHLTRALAWTALPVKQAVISPSALSLLYPPAPIAGYGRDAFVEDLLREHETEIRRCLVAGAHSVQIDFTEGRLACKIDPSGSLLENFMALSNIALDKFSEAERRRIGVHTCPGGDCDLNYNEDVDYFQILPSLFELKVGNFYIALVAAPKRRAVLELIRDHLRPDQRVFVGVVAPFEPVVETPEEVCARVLEAAEYIPPTQLGTTDDCGFAPFCDDTLPTRETAFAKIAARVEGTRLAAARLGLA